MGLSGLSPAWQPSFSRWLGLSVTGPCIFSQITSIGARQTEGLAQYAHVLGEDTAFIILPGTPWPHSLPTDPDLNLTPPSHSEFRCS